MNNTNVNAEKYLDYLDKEMHIMGVLSTFCLAVPSLIIERLASWDDKSVFYTFFSTLLNSGSPPLFLGIMLMFLGAAFFYKQRSRLAWTFGQIALEIALPNYTGSTLENRLKVADSWKTWIPYHCAKAAGYMSILGFTCAVLSVYFTSFRAYCWLCALAVAVLFGILCIWIYHNSEKYNYDNTIHIPLIG
jgi:hypothetical protein